MASTTPMQQRCNEAYDRLRRALAKEYPDHAEHDREDVLMVLTMIAMEIERYPARKSSKPYMRAAHVVLSAIDAGHLVDPVAVRLEDMT